jgi:cobalt-zinc-cadmium efflux system outer membrane protein
MSNRRVPWTLGLLLLNGCSYGVSEITDQTVCDLTAQVRDLEPKRPAAPVMPPAVNGKAGKVRALPNQGEEAQEAGLFQADKVPPPPDSLFPNGIPGLDAEGFGDEKTKDMTEAEKQEYYKKLYKRFYPPLDPIAPDLKPAPGPDGKPLTLSDLQRLATAHSPAIKRAVAAVEAAKGAAEQAGAYPNPLIGYEADTAGSAATAGFQGFFLDQIIKTGNKLKLQQAAAIMDQLNAELALRRAQSDLSSQVRQNYFQVLVALETIKVNKALVQFSDKIYEMQKDLMQKAPLAAGYEPMQVRPLAFQARFNLEQARNQYQASWKQLASSLGLSGMPPTELAGGIDVPVPVFDYDKVLAHVLERHTDILTARNDRQKALYSLRLAQVTPYPDIEVRVAIQKDFTAPPFQVVHSVQVGGPLPIWDQNRGNIRQAEGQLIQAREEEHLARNSLANTLADAFNRYATNRRQVEITLDQIRDQVRVYEKVHKRRNLAADVGFNDVVTAQQTLSGYISNYVAALSLQWTAVVDVANLLQSDDLFQMAEKKSVAPVPDLNKLAPLSCDHPCAPLPDKKYLHGADGQWPPTAPDSKTKPMEPADSQTRKNTRTNAADDAPTVGRPTPLRRSQPNSAWASDREPTMQMEELEEPPPTAPKSQRQRP